MDSKQLLATGSAVFADLLSPEGQANTRRCLDVNRWSKLLTSAKYVLDLTPQMEGDESAYNVTLLSLSDGVRDWWRYHHILNVSKYLVSGHDDNCPDHYSVVSAQDQHYIEHKNIPTSEGVVGLENVEYPTSRKIDDYCPVRHRATILRLLMAIRHQQLVLDSAPRVATITVIAKSLDCIKVVVCGFNLLLGELQDEYKVANCWKNSGILS